MSTVATRQILGAGELKRLSPRFWLARQTQLALFWGPVFIASIVVALIVNVSAADLLPVVDRAHRRGRLAGRAGPVPVVGLRGA